jgi:hypothetical protein
MRLITLITVAAAFFNLSYASVTPEVGLRDNTISKRGGPVDTLLAEVGQVVGGLTQQPRRGANNQIKKGTSNDVEDTEGGSETFEGESFGG